MHFLQTSIIFAFYVDIFKICIKQNAPISCKTCPMERGASSLSYFFILLLISESLSNACIKVSFCLAKRNLINLHTPLYIKFIVAYFLYICYSNDFKICFISVYPFVIIKLSNNYQYYILYFRKQGAYHETF